MEIDGNSSWQWMILVSLVLGIRHGFDLDHLATIDALSRTVRENRKLSQKVGFFFSLGHGIVVICVSLIIGGGLMHSEVPHWLKGFGSWISIFFLVVFGLNNLWNVLNGSSVHTPEGIKSFLAKKMMQNRCSTSWIFVIGALFAFSFDTFSQIALFSLSASLLSGYLLSGVLGLCFMLGMMISDGLNGLFVAKLIQRADKASIGLSRSLGLLISIFSLIIAFWGFFNFFKVMN